MNGIDHQLIWFSTLGSQLEEYLVERTRQTATGEPVVERLIVPYSAGASHQ